MTRFLLGALLASAIAFPASAALKQGDTAPDFKAKASLAGNEFNFSLADALKKGPVVVFFYPNAFSQGCAMEAKAFADNKEKFEAAGATFIGVSTDRVATLKEYSVDTASCSGKVSVAEDPEGVIAKSYDVKLTDIKPGQKTSRGTDYDKPFYSQRVSFVITPDSKIVATLPSGVEGEKVGFADHATKSLAVVEQLKAAKH